MKTAAIGGWGLVVAGALALLPGVVRAQHFPPDDDLETMLRYLVEDGETPGIVLGVLELDGSTSVVGYGTAGQGGSAVAPDTRFELGALTMTFTGTMLGEMVSRGEVALDDPVSRYLPAGVAVPSFAGAEITLGDLATHRSGLPAGPAAADLTREELYDLLSDHELERAPGRVYRFSTIGYALLGHALSLAAGRDYAELLRGRVLEPLGMEGTGYEFGGGTADGMARGHHDGEVVAYSEATEAMYGATGLRSSAADMLRFLKANARPASTVLEPAVRMAQEIRVERGSPDEDVGYGFSWRTYTIARQPPLLTHAGGTAGFSARMALDPAAGIGTILLANTRGFDDWIGRDLLFPDPRDSMATVPVDRAVLERYTGTYEAGVGTYRASPGQGHYFVRLEDEGYLTYQPRGKVRTRLYASSDSTFFMLRGPYGVTFHRAGEDVKMTIRVDEREREFAGRTWTAWKVDEDTPAPRVAADNAPFWAGWGRGTWVALGVLMALALGAISRPLWSARRAAAA